MGGQKARIRAAVAALVLSGLGPAGGEGLPQSAPSASPAGGEAPLTVAFTPNVHDAAFYQWQFDRKPGGPFAADYASETADPVGFTYSAPGTYTAVLRVHDALTGAVQDHSLTIQVLPPAGPPAVTLQASAALVPAGGSVTFTAAAAVSPGRALTGYLWDVDGDGRIDETRPPGPSAQLTRTFEEGGSTVVSVTAVDDRGLAGSASVPVEVRRVPDLSFPAPVPPIAVAGEPFTFQASAVVHPPGTLASWHWDFGDGTTSAAAPPVSHVYAAAGGRAVALTVVDSAGLSSSRQVGLQVVTRPALVPQRSDSEFRVWAFPPPKTVATLYRWDVNDDGTIEFTSPGGPSAAIGPVGRVRVHVQLSNGAVLTEAWSVPIGKSDPPSPKIPFVTVRATADAVQVDARSTEPPPTLTVRVGHVVRFSAAAGLNAPDPLNLIDLVLWDFEGDTVRDQTDRLLELRQPSVSNVTAEFQYQTVGRSTVAVKAVETLGGSAQAVLTVDVVPGTGALETWISQPRPGQRIWGNRVSLQARASPAGRVGRIDFDARPAGGGAWKRIGTAVPPPYSSLGVVWDVTRVPAGEYDLRARATSVDGQETADSEALRPVRVVVDPDAPEVQEFAADGFMPTVRIHTIDPASSHRTEIAGDTAIEFPPAAFAARATVRMERPTSNPHPLEARQQGLHFVPGSFRRLHLAGQTLDKPSRIALYDLNPGGVLDSLAVDKTRLRIFQFDDLLRQWVPLFSQVVQPNEDLARATFMSMGDIGLVVDRAPVEGGGSGSGGCGLLGPELLLLLLLRRPRRSD